MNCPQCNGENIDQTSKFDMSIVFPTEARHDFECSDCGCLFQIVFQPIQTILVETGTNDDEFSQTLVT